MKRKMTPVLARIVVDKNDNPSQPYVIWMKGAVPMFIGEGERLINVKITEIP